MQKQAPKLVIMAAGMGSRFGGLKQMEPVDREGHSIIDFSMYDARRAGFRDLVFIIKREHEALFRERIGTRMERFFHVEYVYQELTDIPAGYSVPDGRVKPWGTGQAVACCRNVLHGPFAVINSDDFYGRTAFSTIYEFLRTNDDEHCYAMVGYRVRNTVTEFGSVARGVCEVENGMLTSITERMQIYQRGDHAAYTEDGTQFVDLPGDTIVSMNLWGFTQPMVSELWSRLSTFLAQQVPQNPMKCEFYLPNAVNQQLEDGTARVRVLPCEEVWHGVTYREDLASVKGGDLCAQGRRRLRRTPLAGLILSERRTDQKRLSRIRAGQPLCAVILRSSWQPHRHARRRSGGFRRADSRRRAGRFYGPSPRRAAWRYSRRRK
ncbi:MAG: sugar phosphate nucleotidyltransferase [Acutalibacteraceae bacterium]